eukprot:5338679-Pyramimonas_sp.AAC.1
MERIRKDAKATAARDGRRPAGAALIRSLLRQKANMHVNLAPESPGKKQAHPRGEESPPGLGVPSSSKQFA